MNTSCPCSWTGVRVQCSLHGPLGSEGADHDGFVSHIPRHVTPDAEGVYTITTLEDSP